MAYQILAVTDFLLI